MKRSEILKEMNNIKIPFYSPAFGVTVAYAEKAYGDWQKLKAWIPKLKTVKVITTLGNKMYANIHSNAEIHIAIPVSYKERILDKTEETQPPISEEIIEKINDVLLDCLNKVKEFWEWMNEDIDRQEEEKVVKVATPSGVQAIEYSRVFSLPGYQNEKIGVVCNVADDDDVHEKLDVMRSFVVSKHERGLKDIPF